jgi:hypothetical protein
VLVVLVRIQSDTAFVVWDYWGIYGLIVLRDPFLSRICTAHVS